MGSCRYETGIRVCAFLQICELMDLRDKHLQRHGKEALRKRSGPKDRCCHLVWMTVMHEHKVNDGNAA